MRAAAALLQIKRTRLVILPYDGTYHVVIKSFFTGLPTAPEHRCRRDQCSCFFLFSGQIHYGIQNTACVAIRTLKSIHCRIIHDDTVRSSLYSGVPLPSGSLRAAVVNIRTSRRTFLFLIMIFSRSSEGVQ